MRRMRFLLPLLILASFFIMGLLLTNPSSAQNGASWLPFDGTSKPSEPILIVKSADSSQIELQASLPGAYAETVLVSGAAYTRLSGTGYGYPATYGLPELPVLRHEVEIPFGAQVSVEVVSSQYTDTSLARLGLNPIFPMQPPVVKLESVEASQPFTIDAQYYTSGSYYPASVVQVGEPYIVRGHRILQVEVWPVAYNPSQASLRLYSQVSFRLVLTGADMTRTLDTARRYASPEFDRSLSRRVLNYNQGLPLTPATPVGFLIISADAYADALAPLVALRENRGFDVTLTRQSQIPGGTTTAGIKAYIQTAYDTWPLPPSYVLLVGDTNTIPTFTGPIIGTSTDLYYATMDGSADWHPDIGRGRFPVRTVAQTTYMVDKYLFYAGLTGQEPWLKWASFPASCDSGYHGVAEATHDYVIGSYTNPGGWTGIFPNNPNPGGDQLYCIAYNANHQNLVNSFNQGRWAIIYSGHGSYSGWEMSYVPDDIRIMPTNSMYPFVASHACLTGDFGETEVFGETWVLQQNKGAMVYWGSATYSYWGEDDVLERSTFDELFTDVSPHADVTAMTYAGLAGVEAEYPSSAQYYWETYNVLGDPTFHIFMEPDQPGFTLNVDPTELSVCTEGSASSGIQIGSLLGYSSTVYLQTGTLPFNVAASFDPPDAPAPYTSTLTLDVTAGAPEGDHTIAITATDNLTQTLGANINLRINTQPPASPDLLMPPDAAVDQPFKPTFSWEALPLTASYNFELATSPLFEIPLVVADGLSSPTFTPSTALDGRTCYWWHAQAENACDTGAWAAPFHFRTVALGTSFLDDMEAGSGLWSHTAAQGTDHWAVATDQSHSPTHAWFVPDDSVITDSRLWTTTPIHVGTGSTLTFWHRYAFEGTSYDGSVLEISTNNGVTWTDLGPFITTNGYNGTISSGYSNPLGDRQGWTGDLDTWTEVTVNLSSFDGQDVQIRWRLGCDSSVGDTGWYIDDVLITAPLPANPAPTLESILPNTGNNTTPTPVVILGTNFIGAPALKLGDTWLESVAVVDANTINAVVPAGLPLGTYDLTLFNGDCQAVRLPEAFTVTTEDEPITGLEATNDGPTLLGDVTNFSASVETGTNVTYAWDFGDGATGAGQQASHQYAAPGIYTATVTASNSSGSFTATTQVTVFVQPEQHFAWLPVVIK